MSAAAIICACWTRPSTACPTISEPMSPRRSQDRRLRPRRLAVHGIVQGLAVSALRLPGRTAAVGRTHGRSRRQRDADVSGGLPGEVASSARTGPLLHLFHSSPAMQDLPPVAREREDVASAGGLIV